MFETKRLKLQNRLETIIEHVYFQPPDTIIMEYPCIVYNLISDNGYYANNALYKHVLEFQITVITTDALPNETMTELLQIEYSRFDRHYVADHLHHYLFTIQM